MSEDTRMLLNYSSTEDVSSARSLQIEAFAISPSDLDTMSMSASPLTSPADSNPVLSLERVTFQYDATHGIRDLSCVIHPGEIVALIGPNGSGKTTSLSLITGQLTPQAGRIAIDGHDLAKGGGLAARASLGFVPDRPDLYEYLTGRQYVHFVAGLYGLTPREADEASNTWWERFDLESARDQLVKTYSHGMRQRCVIIAMLTHRPKLFILDEPIVGLDPQSARTLKQVLREHAAQGGAVLFSTHLLSIAQQITSRVLVLRAGELLADTTLEDLRTAANLKSNDDPEELFFAVLQDASMRERLAALAAVRRSVMEAKEELVPQGETKDPDIGRYVHRDDPQAGEVSAAIKAAGDSSRLMPPGTAHARQVYIGFRDTDDKGQGV